MNAPSINPLARLLIVDDEATQMTALCRTLEDEGYATTGFTSARKALVALREQEFDLVLTDLMMPDMDGIAFLTAGSEIDRNLVAVVMTGHGAIDTAVQAMQAGALDYIQKPFKLRQILPVIARALTVRRLRLANVDLQRRVQKHTEQLENANQELEAFSYTVSHDLRAPLRVITGHAEMLAADHLPQLAAEAKHSIDTILSASRRMAQLINDLLELARLSRQELGVTRIQTTQLAQQVLDDLQTERGSRMPKVKLNELPECHGDESLIRQVFVNLLSNALKFTQHREQPLIEICGRIEGSESIYSVRDNGAGFDMAQAEKLFGVFQRLHSANEFEGTGVGLSIVNRIVSRHGGRAWAEGEVAKGATFYFSLPTN